MKKILLILLFIPLLGIGQSKLIQSDKLSHFMVGNAIGAATNFIVIGISKDKEQGVKNARWIAPLTAIIIGGLKEYVYDKNNGGTVEFMDVFWTGAGGATGSEFIQFTIRIGDRRNYKKTQYIFN